MNNETYDFHGEGECCNTVYVELNSEYKDLGNKKYIGGKIINIKLIKTIQEGENADNDYIEKHIYEILFSDYSIFRFNIKNIHNGFYNGYLCIEQTYNA
uniref:Uncharacterized protein n=1 Tax=Pithovirus LCPAC101 TaxID=2506586 RepID=A0A481Z319_9VIRU|nr:MAG: hypothetical protein LCPAC101_00340 [Pithovirus LCPAC101]